MTAIQQLIEIIKQKRKESEISNTLLKFVQFKAEMLFKTEKEQQEDFAINFSNWLARNHYVLYNESKSGIHFWKNEHSKGTIKELLKIYKNETKRKI